VTLLAPGRWPLLLLAPLAVLVLWALDRRRARRLRGLAGAGAPRVASLAPARRRARRLWFAAGVGLAALALLRPAWGAAPDRLEPRGADVALCLDVSRSMLARDLAPSRLERAQEEIAALKETAGGDRLALVLFAGEATLVAPRTRDLDAVALLAGRAGPASVPTGGSDQGAALEAARAALDRATGEHAAIVLLTDGEDHEGRGRRAAAACREAGIAVHCVGYGSARGAKIPVGGTDGEVFLRDRAGAEVVTALEPARLAALAEAGGGAFADAGETDGALPGLYEEHVRPRAEAAYRARAGEGRAQRFQWPLLAAFLCWIMEGCLRERR